MAEIGVEESTGGASTLHPVLESDRLVRWPLFRSHPTTFAPTPSLARRRKSPHTRGNQEARLHSARGSQAFTHSHTSAKPRSLRCVFFLRGWKSLPYERYLPYLLHGSAAPTVVPALVVWSLPKGIWATVSYPPASVPRRRFCTPRDIPSTPPSKLDLSVKTHFCRFSLVGWINPILGSARARRILDPHSPDVKRMNVRMYVHAPLIGRGSAGDWVHPPRSRIREDGIHP